MSKGNFENLCNDTEDKYEVRLTPQMVANPIFQRQVRDVILTLIPGVPRLANLYMTWQFLTTEDKRFIDEYAKNKTTGIELYTSLLDALSKWDKMQETEGAPGSEPGLVNFSGHRQIESAISDAMYLVETIICNLQTSINSNGDSDFGKILPLSTSLRSVYEENKDRGDSTIEFMYHQQHIITSVSLDNLPSLLDKQTFINNTSIGGRDFIGKSISLDNLEILLDKKGSA